MSGERTATPHLPWTERALTRGTAVNFELMGNRRRYQVTQGRTIHIGPAPEPLRRLEGILLDAIADVLGFIRPGVTCGEVADRLQAALARNGIVKESRCGYSQGIAYPPTGGELTASFRKGDRTELQAGAVMHFLPALWQDQHSLVISEPLVVTDSGCECLCSTPRQLFVRD
jgi:ectoine hydrolase